MPSETLLSLLTSLRLATADEVRRIAPSVRRTAGDLAVHDEAWIDALRQVGRLTPLQADWIRTGRGQRLRVGPAVIQQQLTSRGWADVFLARQIESGEPVRLYIAPVDAVRRDEVGQALEALVQFAPQMSGELLLPIRTGGVMESDSPRQVLIWATSRHVVGVTAADWMIAHGRLPAAAAMSVARQTGAALTALKAIELPHGDLCTANLLIDGAGHVRLAAPGLRTIVRPREGYAHADLPPAAYDTLAPERIEPGVPPDWATEVYALGALWWQLLAGRPPFTGGDSATKLRALHRARWAKLCEMAPDAPPELLGAIEEMTRIAASDRACDFAIVRERLEACTDRRLVGSLALPGRARPAGALAHDPDQKELARLVRPKHRVVAWPRRPRRTAARSRESFPWAATTLVFVAALGGVGWPLWQNLRTQQADATIATTNPSEPSATQLAEPARLANTAAEPIEPPTDASPEPSTAQVVFESEQPELLLATDGPNAWPPTPLRPGTIIRPRGAGRATLTTPPEGLPINVSGVVFQDIDFIDPHGGTLIALSAAGATFERCTFRSAVPARIDAAPLTAIRWQSFDEGTSMAASGKLVLRDCHFHALGTAIAVERPGGAVVNVTNSLFTSVRDVMAFDHLPRLGGPIEIALAQVTVRDAGRLIALREMQESQTMDHAGRLALSVHDTVLALGDAATLVQVETPQPPLRLLQQFDWSGDGSLVTDGTPILIWHDGSTARRVTESQLAIEGLTRTRVEFAGEDLSQSVDSRAIEWHAPRTSPDAPGASLKP